MISNDDDDANNLFISLYMEYIFIKNIYGWLTDTSLKLFLCMSGCTTQSRNLTCHKAKDLKIH